MQALQNAAAATLLNLLVGAPAHLHLINLAIHIISHVSSLGINVFLSVSELHESETCAKY